MEKKETKKEDEDLETLIVAEVVDESYDYKQRKILAWDLFGTQELLAPREISVAANILATQPDDCERATVNNRHFERDEFAIHEYELKNNQCVRCIQIIQVEDGEELPDNSINFFSAVEHTLLIGDCRGNLYFLDTYASDSKPVRFTQANRRAPIHHANLLSLNERPKLLVQYDKKKKWPKEIILYDKLSGKKELELSLPPQKHVLRSATLTTPQTLKILPLGTGNIDCKKNTSFIIEADRKYLVDAPPLLEDMLEENKQEISEINDIILTHMHPDHFNGFEQFLYKKIKADQKLNIYTAKQIYDEALARLSPWIRRQAESKILRFNELNLYQPYETDSIKITVRQNMHETGVLTLGFKFYYKKKTLGYSGDCKYLGEDNLKKLRAALNEAYREATDLGLAEIVARMRQEDNNKKPEKVTERAKRSFTIAPDDSKEKIEEIMKRAKRRIIDTPDEERKLDASVSDALPIAYGNWVFAKDKAKRYFDDKINLFSWKPSSAEALQSYAYLKSKKLCLSAKDCLIRLNLCDMSSFEWFRDCDLILHEASDSDLDSGVNIESVHTHVSELEKLPENIRSKLYITHLPPGFQERYKGLLRILKAGMRYRV